MSRSHFLRPLYGAYALLRDPSLQRKAMTFAAIGLVNTGVDYVVFTLAYLYLGLAPVFANFVSWLVSVTGSYILNTFVTFAAESGRVLRWRDYGKFLGSGIAGFVANTAAVVLLAYVFPVLVAK